MIKSTCCKCQKELNEFGAILLSPTFRKSELEADEYVEKFHLCADCYKDVFEFIVNDIGHCKCKT